MSDTAIKCDELTKQFGSLTAVNQLQLEVRRGEIVGFLGPNGAGKTTTIRMLMGFIRPTSGACSVLGFSPGAGASIRKRIGYLPGDLRIDPSLTGNELLNWFATLRGEVNHQRRRELLDLFSLDPSRPFGTLSKGNRQKIGLIQAFEHNPDVLILDEPTSGLDPLLQQTFLNLLKQSAERGAGILYSSHALHEVEQASHRVAIIRSGELATVSTIESLLDQARQRLSLHFVGSFDVDALLNAPHVEECTVEGNTATLLVNGPVGDALRVATTTGNLLRVRNVGDELEELFVSLYKPESKTDEEPKP